MASTASERGAARDRCAYVYPLDRGGREGVRCGEPRAWHDEPPAHAFVAPNPDASGRDEAFEVWLESAGERIRHAAPIGGLRDDFLSCWDAARAQDEALLREVIWALQQQHQALAPNQQLPHVLCAICDIIAAIRQRLGEAHD